MRASPDATRASWRALPPSIGLELGYVPAVLIAGSLWSALGPAATCLAGAAFAAAAAVALLVRPA
jgi:hypothetical protein